MFEQSDGLLGGTGEIDTIRALCHDLREPLAAIMLLSTSAKGDVGGKLEAISRQAQWLAELVASSLDQAAEDDLQWVEVGAAARAAAERARCSTAASITVRAVSDGWAWARPVALGRALGCLLDNAVRAGGPDGHVVVTVAEVDDVVHVSVRDDGPGLGRVAHRTSLGLTTVRAMVAACRGAFSLSAADGGGAVAEIALPAGTVHLAVS
ncbi:sensor histidine kinase [Terrabacter sp. C0L_2]|uniref:sensor histidine kinase n=1 Tax=Terrabacter sp. C0L_2 TaxID=3108389 RepID=UPI002ED33B04|nr:HAMP domain-containing sensor histidine kinase [Terrabacter sp. C0L_2]